MTVENRIIKVQKRNRALVRFDSERIRRAISRAGESIGGFQRDRVEGVNGSLFDRLKLNSELTAFLADSVTILLNANPNHLTSNFPPTIEQIQDGVLHVLRSFGFQHTADAYACYRWGRHWLREGAINQAQFIGNGAQAGAASALKEFVSIQELNRAVADPVSFRKLVQHELARYERALDSVAAKIMSRRSTGALRMIWVAGPSSSGKTTTTVKLANRLCRLGCRIVVLNLDDYFWPLVEHPTDWINDRNYENPEALDIQLLNEHLKHLLNGKSVEQPVFDFKEGRRVGSKLVRLEPDDLLLLDCLHGLYPPLTEGISGDAQFRIFLDAQPAVFLDDLDPVQPVFPSDYRLMRRMLRDARHRNHSPVRTLLHWHYVRSGELYSILPLQGLADAVLNTGFGYELAVLKSVFVEPAPVLPTLDELKIYGDFLDAEIRLSRVRKLLARVDGLSRAAVDDYLLIPGDAVTREFIGGSSVAIPHND